MTRILILLASLLVVGNTYALPPCPTGVFHNCFGSITHNGTKYVGEWKDDRVHGKGTSTWPNGHKYVGEWKDGEMHGQGIYTEADGTQYVGEFKEHKRNGQGTATLPDGTQYVGEWKDGKHHGQGTKTWPDGHKYVGEWKVGKEHGQGTYTRLYGFKYVGELKVGKPHGQGILTQSNGFSLVGEFEDGLLHGQGTSTYPSGRVFYSGLWVNGKMVDKKLESFEIIDRPKMNWSSGVRLDDKQKQLFECMLEDIKYLEKFQEAERTISSDPDFVALNSKFFIEAIAVDKYMKQAELIDVSPWYKDPPFHPIDSVEARKIRLESLLPSLSARQVEALTRLMFIGETKEVMANKEAAEEFDISTVERTSITDFPDKNEQELLRQYFCLTDGTWQPAASLLMRCNLLGFSKELAESAHSWIEMSASAQTSLMIDLINGRITFGEYQSELNKTEGWVQTSLASIGDTTYLEWQTSLRNSLVRRGLIDSNDQPAAKRTFSCADD
jgi:hypothetical protein